MLLSRCYYKLSKRPFIPFGLELAENLVAMGADPFFIDKNNYSAVDWARKVGLSEEFIETIAKEGNGEDQGRKGKKVESFSESMITYSERTFSKEPAVTPESPGALTKAFWGAFDYLVTDQVSWIRYKP